MARYLALVDFADGAYGVSFPDAPGCTAMATTMDEAINDAADALAEWMADEIAEGRAPPVPRNAIDLVTNDEVSEALSSGAVFASIPVILNSGKLARANISLDVGLLAEIDEEARKRGVTRSAFLAAAARDKIKASA
jgi:predicted RNase H-like HicB family nuclease